MLIAVYEPETFELVELVGSFPRFKALFPDRSWVNPVTDAHLVAQGVPARVVQEVEPPALGYGERASYTAERQQDGSWLQVWSVEGISLAEAKNQLLAQADALLAARLPAVNPILRHAFLELQVAETEIAAGMTPAAARFPLINAIATARGISLTQAGQRVQTLRNAWVSLASPFVAPYEDVVTRIKDAASIAEAKEIYDELEAIE